MRSVGITVLILLCVLPPLYSQDSLDNRCMIIDMNKDSGTVTIRSIRQGWINQFRPDVLEAAELQVGDTVDVSWTIHQVSAVKGISRRYPLLKPEYGVACCDVADIRPGKHFTITARNISGETLRFEVADSIASMISVGHKVYTQPTHGYAMLLIGKDSASTSLYGFPLLQK